jgi:hypothetical protein
VPVLCGPDVFDSLLPEAPPSRRGLLASLLLHGGVLLGLSFQPEQLKVPTPSRVLLGSVRIFSPALLDLVETPMKASKAEGLRPAAEEPASIAAQKAPIQLEQLETPPTVQPEVPLPLPEQPALTQRLPSLLANQSPAPERAESWKSVELRPPADESPAEIVSPLESHRAWARQAEESVINGLRKADCLRPRGKSTKSSTRSFKI